MMVRSYSFSKSLLSYSCIFFILFELVCELGNENDDAIPSHRCECIPTTMLFGVVGTSVSIGFFPFSVLSFRQESDLRIWFSSKKRKSKQKCKTSILSPSSGFLCFCSKINYQKHHNWQNHCYSNKGTWYCVVIHRKSNWESKNKEQQKSSW